MAQLEADGPAGHLELLCLRLYNPTTRQWTLNYANSGDGTLETPLVGKFNYGRGEFYDQQTFDGKAIFVRQIWSDITKTSAHFEQSFSADGGKTWKVNFIENFTRISDDGNISGNSKWSSPHEGVSHDFDFEIGIWNTHVSRILHPLSGSETWADYHGTSTVESIWNGRANLVELEVEGPSGHIEGLNLRLYNPRSQQWNLTYANSRTGTLSNPTIGEFKSGRGEFYDQEALNERSIFVRFVISDIHPHSCHFEQSFSDDGGKTWEVNWIATDTRMTKHDDIRKSGKIP